MEIMSTENCFVCGEWMTQFKSPLNNVTLSSEKTIFSLIGKFEIYVIILIEKFIKIHKYHLQKHSLTFH